MTAIVSPSEMAAAEQAVFATGVDSFSVMRRAGESVANSLHARFPRGDIRVLCGPGGNGGDGYVAADRLRQLGRTVRVYALAPPERAKGDNARALKLWNGFVAPLGEAMHDRAAITLDALFGGGLSRPLSDDAARLAEEGGETVAVDAPSGLDGLTARPLGPCLQAALTVTFAGYRPAHVLSPGRAICGDVVIAEIGVPLPLTVRTNDERVWRGTEPGQDWEIVDASEVLGSASNAIEAAQALARTRGRIVLQLGPETLAAHPDGRCIVDGRSLASASDRLRNALQQVSEGNQITLPEACRTIASLD